MFGCDNSNGEPRISRGGRADEQHRIIATGRRNGRKNIMDFEVAARWQDDPRRCRAAFSR
jgi:hypothetical protein